MIPLKKRIELRTAANQFCIEKKFEQAIRQYKEGLQLDPTYLWYELFIGDIYLYYLHDSETAYQWYLSCYEKGIELFDTSAYSPLRYVLKRLSKLTWEKKEYAKAIPLFEKFISFRPSNFHDSDFLRYADTLMHLQETQKAIEILELGKKYSKSSRIQRKLNELKQEDTPITTIPEILKGYRRIPIKTDVIKPGDNIFQLLDTLTSSIRQEGDIITVASCVIAVVEERYRTIDVATASRTAKLLSSFVHNDDFDFGGNAPLCNPLSMQLAIDESGWFRIVSAAIFGGVISKLWKGSGMFYRMAGEQAALIDDMPGAIAPFDYSIILGPTNSDTTSEMIKKITGCDAAVIDANDLNIAWVVGSSNHELDPTIRDAMTDNPAGNGDQQTPFILLRPV